MSLDGFADLILHGNLRSASGGHVFERELAGTTVLIGLVHGGGFGRGVILTVGCVSLLNANFPMMSRPPASTTFGPFPQDTATRMEKETDSPRFAKRFRRKERT